MAFDGWADKKITFFDAPHRVYLSTGESPYFPRRDIPGYFTPFFYEAYTVWSRYTKFGLPNGQGWKQEREIVVKVIEVFESERDAWHTRKIKDDSRRAKSANNR